MTGLGALVVAAGVVFFAMGCGCSGPAAESSSQTTEPRPELQGPLVDPVPETPPGPVGPSDPVEENAPALALGATHTCFFDEGAVRCWGGNQFGQLGDPSVPRNRNSHRDAGGEVQGLTDTVAVEAGTFHTCAVDSEGEVRCFGHGGYGQLGNNGREDSAVPVVPNGLPPVSEISLGEGHTCARTRARELWCWGKNGFGQLGDGSQTDRLEPVRIGDFADVAEVALGRDHTCIRRRDAGVFCFGAASDGQMGDGETHQPSGVQLTPLQLETPEPVTGLSAGTTHTCGITAGGSVVCWGGNDSGQLGHGRGGRAGGPELVRGLSGVLALSVGGRHSCARTRESIECWGGNNFGQLGDDSRTPRREPVAVRLISDPLLVSLGPRHSCALHGEGELSCWGSNQRGQLGDRTDEFRTRPTPVRALP